MFVNDFVLNGQVHGAVGDALAGARFDPGYLRPFYDRRNQRCVTVQNGYKYSAEHGRDMPIFKTYRIADLQRRGVNSPVFNATALRKEEWLHLDQVVLREARYRMRAYGDLANANSYGGFNGMAKMILEHETMSDAGQAQVDMDGLTDVQGDAPTFQLEGLPLPITHAGFSVSQRKLAISRNTGTPLDTSMGEMMARRCGESIERQTIGTGTALAYGGNSTQVGGYGRTAAVYGYMNFPQRLTSVTLTVPLGTNPEATVADVLSMRAALRDNKFYGPYMLYHSTDWDAFLDNDYMRLVSGSNSVGGALTLRERLKRIDDVQDVRRLDFLRPTASATGDPAKIPASHAFTMIMVQMTSDVCRAVNGLDITTVQWEGKGGLELHFMVMAIQVPQLRATKAGNCGILHAHTA